MIAIIDYGMGNLRSVQKAFEYLGHEAVVTDDKAQIMSADKLVLPGVGAFCDAMARLRETGLDKTAKAFAASGKPLLGICLGMQLMFDRSFEGGEYEGLGLIKGDVVRFDIDPLMKVPHMGWNSLDIKQPSIFSGVDNGAYAYFVHSYYCVPDDAALVSATCGYGVEFAAAVHKDNVIALQYHPEKSGDAGLLMLKNFAEIKV